LPGVVEDDPLLILVPNGKLKTSAKLLSDLLTLVPASQKDDISSRSTNLSVFQVNRHMPQTTFGTPIGIESLNLVNR
jgi:hypothetical protein